MDRVADSLKFGDTGAHHFEEIKKRERRYAKRLAHAKRLWKVVPVVAVVASPVGSSVLHGSSFLLVTNVYMRVAPFRVLALFAGFNDFASAIGLLQKWPV